MLLTITLLVLIGGLSAIIGSIVGIGAVLLSFQQWFTSVLNMDYYIILQHK